ncbi:MAG: hypothetical protein HUK22_05575 [Thermoguttaceae bacterium]|nr:hypothetical protein [Thermoguttaceae bacterium]
MGEYSGETEAWESEPQIFTAAEVLAELKKLDPLPDGLADAFENLKLEILNHKVAKWAEVQPVQIAAYLSAMKKLLVAVEVE